MPREIRTIILSDAELKGAIDSFRRVHKELLPPGTVHGIEAQPDGSILIAIEMKFGPNIRNDSFILEQQHVVEAFVRFCIETNIIIPRSGTKKIVRTDKEWILEIRLKSNEMAHQAAYAELKKQELKGRAT
ncbi:hypothetical protein [Nisaea nitritireducens]|uniref:hypothetical protein n=1 Tax=Nisaea nitritireducens TaxID=568392 RepID=UPI0018672F3F|nr:hypothetical protein [Nisaea nitritireducens]